MVGVGSTEGLPELFIFLALFHYDGIAAGSLLVLLEQSNVLLGSFFVELFILRKDLSSFPQPELVLALDNKHGSGVKGLVTFSSLIEVIHLESSYNVEGVLWLMGGHQVHTRADSK